MTDPDARYRCAICNAWGVVPSLARDCETRHKKGDRAHTPPPTQKRPPPLRKRGTP